MKGAVLEIIVLIGLLSVLGTILSFDSQLNLLTTAAISKTSNIQALSSISNDSVFSSNEFLIKVRPQAKGLIRKTLKPTDTGVASLNNLNKKYGVLKFEQVGKEGKKSKKDNSVFRWYKVTFKSTNRKITTNSTDFLILKDIMDSYRSDPNIEVVEPNFAIEAFLAPNDPYYYSNGTWNQSYPDLWGIHKIDPEVAWNQTTGSQSIIVAVIDTGVDRNHTDLSTNMWVNTNETPNNGLDDDGNGYIDDYYGWDWYNNDNNPIDDHGHGTHVSGTIGAVGNNGVGVVGVNWQTKIMALKFLSSGGSGYLDDGIAALQYAADMGARVSSNSWGCSCNSQAMDDAVQYEHDKGMVMVAAAGNSNADAIGFSPASADRAITVAASDSNDTKAYFSNYGEKIDVASPGVDILSLKASTSPMCTSDRTVGTYYCRVSGTSMATPHVAGLVALLLSKNPSLTNEEVRQIIRNGATDLGTPGKDSSFGFGRINATGTIALADTHPLTPLITSPGSRKLVTSPALDIVGSVPGPNFASYKVELGQGRAPTSWQLLKNSTTQVINGVLAVLDGSQLVEDKWYIIRLTATDTSSKNYSFQVHDIMSDNFDALITYPMGLLIPDNFSVNIYGTANVKNALTFLQYKIEWGSSSSWSTAGISLVNNGSQPVIEGLLGSWNTTGLNLTDGKSYYIKLTAIATNGANYSNQVSLKSDKTILPGWPRFINDTFHQSSYITPVSADLDGDGTKEIIVPSQSNILYAFRKDGSDFPGFPVILKPNITFDLTINVDDLNNDGKKEIVGCAKNISGKSPGVYVFNSAGMVLSGWPKASCAKTPTIADLDLDGKKEIVFIESGYTNDTLHAFRVDGSEISGFPKKLPFAGSSSWGGDLSIADLNNDGKPEIISTYNDYWDIITKLYVFDNNGNVLPGWPFTPQPYLGREMYFDSTPTSGDFDGDGQLEVLAILHTYPCCDYQSSLLYALDNNGSLLPGWPIVTGAASNAFYPPFDIPSLVDVNGDKAEEAAFAQNYTVQILDYTGTWLLNKKSSGRTALAVSDINGDGMIELLGSYGNSLNIIKSNGTTYWQRIFTTGQYNAPSIFVDTDNNGKMEVGTVYVPPIHITYPSGGGVIYPADYWAVYLWELPDTLSSSGDWPMYSHDSARTGRFNESISQPSGFDFNISLNPTSGNTTSGSSLNTIVTTNLINGSSQQVSFSCSNLPTGTSCSFAPPSCGPTCISTLTISTSNSTPGGVYNITVSGYGGGISRSTSYLLTVTTPPFDFSMGMNPTSGTVIQGNSIATKATATLLSGITKPVSFSVSELPPYATASFSDIYCNPTCNSILTISTNSSTPIGTYTITITGTEGTINRTTTYTLTINAPPPKFDFNVSANPSSGTVKSGGYNTTLVTANLISGNPQLVSFVCYDMPRTIKCKFGPKSCNPTCISNLTISATRGTKPGSYLITILGSGGGLSRSTTYNLTIVK